MAVTQYDLDKLIAGISRRAGDLVAEAIAQEGRQLYQMGWEAGIKQERERLLALLGNGNVPQLPPTPAPAPTTTVSRTLTVDFGDSRRSRKGSIKEPVLKALGQLARVPEGVDAEDVHNQILTWADAPRITVNQVRWTLKDLEKRKQARRVARGRYVPVDTGASDFWAGAARLAATS